MPVDADAQNAAAEVWAQIIYSKPIFQHDLSLC